jgi:hypothetical protein
VARNAGAAPVELLAHAERLDRFATTDGCAEHRRPPDA